MTNNFDPLSSNPSDDPLASNHINEGSLSSPEEDLSSRRSLIIDSFSINDFFTAELCELLYAYAQRILSRRFKQYHKDFVHDWIVKFLTNWHNGTIDKATFIEKVYLAKSTRQRSFLLISILNEIRIQYRKIKSEDTTIVFLSELETQPECPFHPYFDEALDQDRIVLAIDKVANPQYRSFLRLVYRGLSHQEIRDELDLKSKQFFNLKQRALTKLEKALEEMGIPFTRKPWRKRKCDA